MDLEQIIKTANSLSDTKKYNEAIEYYDKAIVLAPNNGLLYCLKAEPLHGLAKYKESIECYDKAIEVEPTCSLAYSRKGSAFYEAGFHEEAIINFDKSLEYDFEPSSISNDLLLKALALFELDKNDEAIECINKAIETDPNNDNAKDIRTMICREIENDKSDKLEE